MEGAAGTQAWPLCSCQGPRPAWGEPMGGSGGMEQPGRDRNGSEFPPTGAGRNCLLAQRLPSTTTTELWKAGWGAGDRETMAGAHWAGGGSGLLREPRRRWGSRCSAHAWPWLQAEECGCREVPGEALGEGLQPAPLEGPRPPREGVPEVKASTAPATISSWEATTSCG